MRRVYVNKLNTATACVIETCRLCESHSVNEHSVNEHSLPLNPSSQPQSPDMAVIENVNLGHYKAEEEEQEKQQQQQQIAGYGKEPPINRVLNRPKGKTKERKFEVRMIMRIGVCMRMMTTLLMMMTGW